MAPPKGTTNNPAGRPPKNRALTALLESAGNQTIDVGDKKLTAKRFMALSVWSIVTTGKVVLPDGKQWDVPPTEWLDTVKWIYQHIDGPPKTSPAGTEDDPIHYKVYQGFDPTKV